MTCNCSKSPEDGEIKCEDGKIYSEPSMYFRNEKGELLGLHNEKTGFLDPIPMNLITIVAYDKPKKDGSIGHYEYIGSQNKN